MMLPRYEITRVVLAWLLMLGGTIRAPTAEDSPEDPGSSIKLPAVEYEGEMTITIN